LNDTTDKEAVAEFKKTIGGEVIKQFIEIRVNTSNA